MTRHVASASVRPKFQRGRWLPIVAMMLLIAVLGAYTNGEDSSFLTTFNLNGVMIATLPLALAAMGQTSALMVKAFDVSVGALMTLCVVVASFVLGPDESWPSLLLGMLFVIAYRARRRCRQRRPDPLPQAFVDHRHTCDVQRPAGRVPVVAADRRRPDQPRASST